jgi:ABC-type transport system involved in multi-copper enzyme maturation permease subunit
MRAYELIKETFCRKLYILIVHLSWLTIYGGFWWLTLPRASEVSSFGRFIFIWGGFLLPLALSAGIFGNDISSGRICVLVTKPFWPGELYIYRLLGLSLQAAVHFILAWCVVFILHAFMRKGSMNGLGMWLFASWLLFNTCAALSTSLSIVIGQAYNTLLLLVVIIGGSFIVTYLMSVMKQQEETGVFINFIRFACPPFNLLNKFAGGEFGRFSITKSVACVVHSLILTVAYSIAGIVLLSRRQFSSERD